VTRIAISGHRGLSAEVEALIEQAIRQRLTPYAASDLVGLSCLADGADQIFAHAIIDCGGTLEVVVPASGYRDALPEATHHTYDALIGRAVAVHRLSHTESTAQSHMEASIYMLARADLLFAVWDGQPARSFGGTADVVSYAQATNTPVVVIWPAGARRD
jgi:hypothetical protein